MSKIDKNLRKDFLWNTLGTSLNSFVSLVLMVIVTRVNGIEDSGLFTFAFSLSLVFFTIALFGGRTYQVSDIKKEFSPREYIYLKAITSLVAIVAAIIMIIANGYDSMRAGLIISLVVFKIIEAIADPFYGIMQAHGKLYLAGMSMTIKTVASVVFFVIVDILTGNLILSSLCFVVVNALFLVFFDIPRAKKCEVIKLEIKSPKKYIRDAKQIIMRSLIVFSISFFGILIVNIPRYFMDMFHPNQQGYYGIIVMPASLITLFVSFVMQPRILYIAQKHNQKLFGDFKKANRQIMLLSAVFGLLATIITYFIGVQLLSIVYGVNLAAHQTDLTLIVFGGTILIIPAILSNVLIVMRKFREQIIIYVFSIIQSVILGMTLIRAFAVTGGVWMYVIVATSQAIAFFSVYAYALRQRTKPAQ